MVAEASEAPTAMPNSRPCGSNLYHHNDNTQYFFLAHNSTYDSLISRRSVTKLARSASLPPRCPGYSQSKSRPSKPYCWMKDNVEEIKVALFAGSAAIAEYLVEPSFHPPTTANTFSLGFTCFKAIVLLMKPTK